MNIHDVVEALTQHLGRLDKAIAALGGTGSQTRRRGPGRPPKSTGKKHMSASARAKISAAQKARWAKQKGKAAPQKAKAKKTTVRHSMSPAAKKKLSELMKARWAAKKSAHA